MEPRIRLQSARSEHRAKDLESPKPVPNHEAYLDSAEGKLLQQHTAKKLSMDGIPSWPLGGWQGTLLGSWMNLECLLWSLKGVFQCSCHTRKNSQLHLWTARLSQGLETLNKSLVAQTMALGWWGPWSPLETTNWCSSSRKKLAGTPTLLQESTQPPRIWHGTDKIDEFQKQSPRPRGSF